MGSVSRSREQVERLQDRQSGADERDELLIEDEEFLEIQLFSPARNGNLARKTDSRAFRLDGINQEALLRVAFADLLG